MWTPSFVDKSRWKILYTSLPTISLLHLTLAMFRRLTKSCSQLWFYRSIIMVQLSQCVQQDSRHAQNLSLAKQRQSNKDQLETILQVMNMFDTLMRLKCGERAFSYTSVTLTLSNIKYSTSYRFVANSFQMTSSKLSWGL